MGSNLAVDFADMGDDSFEREIQSAAEVPQTIKSILDQDELSTKMPLDHNNTRFSIKIENENRSTVVENEHVDGLIDAPVG